MKTRIDYWLNGERHPLKLSGYGHRLLATHGGGSASGAITDALVAFFGDQTDHMAAAAAFCEEHGMSLSMLVELAVSRHFDKR